MILLISLVKVLVKVLLTSKTSEWMHAYTWSIHHGLYVAGVAPVLHLVAEWRRAARLWRQHVYAAPMFPTTRLEKVLKLNKSCFLWHLCKRSKAGWLYRSARHFPFRDTRQPQLLFPMRSRCRSDLSGLNSFIMRAAHLEGPPTHTAHKEPWKHKT